MRSVFSTVERVAHRFEAHEEREPAVHLGCSSQQLLRPQVAELVCTTDEPGDWRVETPTRSALSHAAYPKAPRGALPRCRCTTIQRFVLRPSTATFRARAPSDSRPITSRPKRRLFTSLRPARPSSGCTERSQDARATPASGAKGDKSRDALDSHGR